MAFPKGNQFWKLAKKNKEPVVAETEIIEDPIITDPVPAEVIEDPIFQFNGDQVWIKGMIPISKETYIYLQQISEGRHQKIEDVITQAFDYLTANTLL